MYQFKKLTPLALLYLTACGGDGDNTSIESFEPVSSLPALNSMAVPIGALASVQNRSFERHLKNGVYLRSQNEMRINFSGSPESSDAASSSGSYSTTTTQEHGVDEGDIVKYDGQHFFIASQQEVMSIAADQSMTSQTSVRILARDTQGDVSELDDIVINEDASHINGMYLSEQVLAVLSDIYDYNIAAMSFAEGFFPMEQEFNLTLIDVNQPSNAEQLLSYTIDGALIDSRRIGNTLYIVSSYSASLNGINYASSDSEKLANYNAIMQADINELLPKYTNSVGEEFTLVSSEDCYLPEESTSKDGFDGIVSLTAINLSNPSEMQSTCVNAQVQGLYASQQALYLYGTEYEYDSEKSSETSVIHKFNLAGNTIDYRATGNVDGRFNWNLSNLRFSEQGDYLRVVTTSGNNIDGFKHRLNVLSEEGNKLQVMSQLPNDINTTPIGKVSNDGNVYEDIEAVRFFKNQAYIVTFLNTDPLYVLDLEDNLNPKIAGELEILGYSAYLQPISDHLLLGIGQNVDPGQLTDNRDDDSSTDDDSSSPVIEGAKVSLFNVSDLTNPQEIHSIVYPEAYTPVEFDYHALTSLSINDGSTRFGIPIERWITETRVDEKGQKYDVWFTENKLALFNVTTLNVNAQLIEHGEIVVKRDEDDLYNGAGWNDRSIFHGDDVYYIHHSKVFRALWSDLNQQTGPY